MLFPQGEAGVPGAPGFPGVRGPKGEQVSGGTSPTPSGVQSLERWVVLAGVGGTSPGLWKRKDRGPSGSGVSPGAKGQGLRDLSAKGGPFLDEIDGNRVGHRVRCLTPDDSKRSELGFTLVFTDMARARGKGVLPKVHLFLWGRGRCEFWCFLISSSAAG